MRYVSFSIVNATPGGLQTALQSVFDTYKGNITIVSMDFLRNPLSTFLNVNFIVKLNPI
jgi:hypothetical protein